MCVRPHLHIHQLLAQPAALRALMRGVHNAQHHMCERLACEAAVLMAQVD